MQNNAARAALISMEREPPLVRLQKPDGAWEGEVIWCPIITAQVVILKTIARQAFSDEERSLLLRQFAVSRRPDGGWGLHPESSSYRFVTTLVYVAARLLGASPEQPMVAQARAFLARGEGAIFGLPQWGKIWLSFIGLYDRRGLNPCPPELFLLPHWVPFSPLNFYCHTRYIYLGMSYLIGSGYQADLGPITAALRSELYGDVPPELAVRHRHDLAPSDAYVYPGRLLRWIYDLTRYLGTAVRYVPGRRLLRRRALDSCIARITFEQRATNFQGLSPVSGILNTLALLSRDSQSRDVAASFAGIESWRWDDAANGSRYAGARSTTWDTSFAIQALLAGGPVRSLQLGESLRRAYRRLTEMQVTDEVAGRGHARDPIQGGWCFSDGAHRWPVSDCTAEAAIAILDCDAVPGLIPVTERLAEARLRQAGGFMLDRQNPDGGFGTYERRRGRRFLEGLNPSQMFGQCMTELSYLECTASSIRALVRLTRRNLLSDPDVGRDAIARGVAFILTQQQRDGSWPGFWGINYIYGTYFALAALRDADLPADHGAFVRADSWLRSVQHADGGWGEHFSGCLSGSFVDHPSSLIISTAWACLALMQIDAGIPEPLRRGIEYLESRRDADSGWPREGVNGVFFGTAMLEYELYNAYFPAMAVSCFEVRSHGVD